MNNNHSKSPSSLSQLATHLVFLVTCVVFLVHAYKYNFVADDAFIFARYAKNVVDGHGWVYNIGAPVEGYTSFLWLVLTVLASKLGLNEVFALRALSCVSILLTMLLAYISSGRFCGARPTLISCFAPLMMALSAVVACWGLGGLDSCGYALIVLSAIMVVDGAARTLRSSLAIGLILSMCILMRPDGALVVLVLGGWLGFHKRIGIRPLLCCAGVVTLIIGVHLLWRYQYYGDWVPNTAHAKVGWNLAQVATGSKYVMSFFADHGGMLMWITPVIMVWLYQSAAFLRLLALVAMTIATSVIAVGGDGLPMYRFMLPVIPIVMLIVQGIVHDALRATCKMSDEPARRLVLFLIVACVGLSVFMKPARLGQLGLYEYQQNVEVPNWTAAGRWLARHANEDDSIACVPIGAVGYYSGLRVYDMMGLTDRHIARKRGMIKGGWAGHEKHDGPYILSKQPTYLLLGNIDVRNHAVPVDDPEFARPRIEAIRKREDDIFIPELFEQYKPRRVQLEDGKYFHFYELRSAMEQ